MSPTKHFADESLVFGTFQLFPSQHVLLEGGTRVHIGNRALQILTTMIERPGVLVSKAELIERVWPETVVEEANLKVHIAALRRILGDGRDGKRYIVNIPGRGYMFVASVTYPDRVPELVPLARATTHPYSLPSPRTLLVGRAEIVRVLADQLAQRRLVTIVGPGGVGKTSVALCVAGELISSFRDGVCFVDLAPVADPKLVPSALAISLGVAVRSDAVEASLITFLHEKSILIVLDSCEHVVTAAAALSEMLLKVLPQTHILSTSREPLRVAGECTMRLPSLAAPPESDSLTAQVALTFSAVELFVARISTQLGPYPLTDQDALFIAEICRRLDGNALAIEMAAGRVHAFGVRGVASLLDDRFKVLSSAWRDAIPRHQTLLVALDWSYDLLAEAERLLLRRLGVFAGYFTLDAAIQVASDGPLTPTAVIGAIANLVDQSLVSADVETTLMNYRLLDTTRAYALNKLREGDEFRAVAHRHAMYCKELLLRTDHAPLSKPSVERAAAYVGQVANVRVALDWAFSAEGDTAIGVKLTIASVPMWLSTSLIEECRRRAARALECLSENRCESPLEEMQLLAAIGVVMYSQGPSPAAKTTWTRVLSLAKGLGDDDYRIRALWGLWVVCVTGGKHQEGLVLAEQVASLAQETSDAVGQLVGDRLVGTSLHFLGRQREAILHFESMLCRPLSSRFGEQVARFQFDQSVVGHAFYSRILWVHGYPDQALRAVEASVSEAQAQGHALSLCYALGQGACAVTLLAGDLDAAESNVSLLVESADKHALPLWQSMGRCFKGMLLVRRGQLVVGLRLLRESSDELRSAGFALYHTAALIEFARCLGQAGEIGRGLATIGQAMSQAKEHEEHWCLPEIMRVKGELLLQQRATNYEDEVERHFLESIELARQQGALSWQLRTAMSLAGFQAHHHRVGDGLSALAQAYDAFTEGFRTRDLEAAKQLLTKLDSTGSASLVM
jgi:predicted ATPase/DNA-binding winged helix-turn-helix (wHTH) protein